MRGRPEQIDHALATLASRVAEQLSADGWNRRLLHGYGIATLTRATQSGVCAVVEIDRTSAKWPDDWPVEVEARLGVGYEPALNLMPLLTLDPQAILVEASQQDGEGRFTVSLDGFDAVAHAAVQVVSFVNEHASDITGQFPDAAAIEARLRCEIGAGSTAAGPGGEHGDEDQGSADLDTQLRLVVLAAMGRREQARTLLATYAAARNEEAIDVDARFTRQVTRWLDAGGPVPPPVEDTLAVLPRLARSPRPSWSDARAASKAKKEALDAARANSKGKGLDQLRELITAEYRARRIDLAPSVIDFNAEMLQVQQQPFGRARSTLKAIRMLTAGGADAIRLLKDESDHDPQWLRPPDRAAYPLIADRNRHLSVDLDATAHDWLERVRTGAPRRVGPWVLIDVWLTRDDPVGPLVAHIGDQRVGIVGPETTTEFDHVLRAAALFDEDPIVKGRLTSADGTGPAVLEIPFPESEIAT